MFAEIRNLSDAYFAVNLKHELFFAVESYVPPAVKILDFSDCVLHICPYLDMWLTTCKTKELK